MSGPVWPVIKSTQLKPRVGSGPDPTSPDLIDAVKPLTRHLLKRQMLKHSNICQRSNICRRQPNDKC